MGARLTCTVLICSQLLLLTFPNRQILDSSKLKAFADDNFKIDENGREFSKFVENTVRTGEIARYEQFLLFPHCFQKFCTATHKFQGLFGKGLIETWVKFECHKNCSNLLQCANIFK